MNKSKKDLIPQESLNKYIIAEYRKGRTIKAIAAAVKHQTIDKSGGHCRRGILSGLYTMK